MAVEPGGNETGPNPHDDDDDDHVPVADEEMPADEHGRANPYASLAPGLHDRDDARTPSGHMRSLPPQAPPSSPGIPKRDFDIPETRRHTPSSLGPPEAPPKLIGDGAAPAPVAVKTPLPGVLAAATGTFERLAPGTVLDDKYVIGVKLGQGGMGAVFRARHKLLGKDVALKVIAPQMAENPSFKARFSREAKVAMEFVHRHAVPLRDFGVTSTGLFYMTMDFSAGRSLRAVVEKDGALEPWRACRIMAQVLEALQEAHRKHIIHRDLKPDNVMVETDGDGKDFVKVLDFGLAKMAVAAGEEEGSQNPSLASGEAILGTPAYMSPEQATGEEVDARTDLYSCGIVLYQLLTGELPFTANTTRQMIVNQVASVPPPLKQKKPDLVLPDGLEALVMRALAKDRKNRFQTADEFKAALDPYADPSKMKPVDTGTMPSERPQNSAAALGQVSIDVGITIDRYKILEKIAEGGFGAVYKAEHVLMHRLCAFKVMKPGLSEDEEFSTRFQREAQVASKFKHPNSVEVYDFGKVGTQLFMAMELVEGKPLTHRIKGRTGKPIVLRDAVEIMCQTLDVLDAAHRAGIVHRDLKPDNIMLNVVEDWPNQVKVLDFGIAKMKGIGDAANYSTQAGSFFGTPQFASPEQCRGELGIDGRSDIYSMGIILFEMLTGKLPFESETAAGFLAAHMVTPPRRVKEASPDVKVPEGVENVIQKALAKGREQRFQTAKEFAEALKRAAGIHPVFEIGDKGVRVASRSSTRPESMEFETQKSFGAVVAVILLVLIGAAFGVWKLAAGTPRGPGSLVIRTTPGGVRMVMSAAHSDKVTIESTDEEGRLSIPSLTPGKYTAIFDRPPEYGRVTRDLTIQPGRETALSVTLTPGANDAHREVDLARDEAVRTRDAAKAAGAETGAAETWARGTRALDQGDIDFGNGDLGKARAQFGEATRAFTAAHEEMRRGADARRSEEAARLARARDDCESAAAEAKAAGAEERARESYGAATERRDDATALAARGDPEAAAKFLEAAALFRKAAADAAAPGSAPSGGSSTGRNP